MKPSIARVIAAAMLLAAAAACGRVPAPPYRLAFAVDVRPPRLLESSTEISVPLTLTNTGQIAWTPDRVHLSYHWLWFVPRELAARSRWNVPYHNGIRTELGSRVMPGARVALEGRVLAPSWPGLYWLQWDMVDEGTAWFAQVGPRQPRTLAIVLPPLVWVLAPLPLLIAYGALVAARTRQSAFAIYGDVAWCFAALAIKPLFVFRDALLEPTATAYWLLLVAAAIPPLVALALPRRLRAWVLAAIGIFGSLLVLADVVYYRFFGDVLSAPALLAAGQTGHLWGSIRALFSWSLVWILIDWPVAVWMAASISRQPTDASAARVPRRSAVALASFAGLALVGMVVSAPSALAAARLDQMFRDRAVVEQLGLFGYHAYDLWNYARSTWFRPAPTDADIDRAAAWFAARAPLRGPDGSPAFGAERGRNLIVVQVESLQDFVVDYTVDGQEVMPHLRGWTDRALRFTRVTDETNQGRTSDAEFATMTSLLPLDQGAVAFRYPANHYAALPRVLVEHGYATLSAVAFEPGFWNRQVMHPAYGFQRTLFESDFQLTEQIGWGLNDRDFLQQMRPRIAELRPPFAAWLITLSLHHPFEDFPARYKVLKLGALEGTSFGNYLHTMRFFDDALERFVEGLEEDGKLATTTLVVFGDHDAGFQRDAALTKAIGIPDSESAWAMNDRVPLFVRAPDAAARGLVGARTTPAGQTDVAPTLLSLLGIDTRELPYLGRNLLGGAGDGPVPRPYGDWIDARHLFLSRGAAPSCFDLSGAIVPADDCRDSARAAAVERDISRLVVTADLQENLRTRLKSAAQQTR